MGAVLSNQGKPDVFHPHSSAQVTARTTKNSKETIQTTLKKLIEERCPSLFTSFHPPWYLFNGHLQTLYSVVGDFSRRDNVVYSRTFLRLVDGGTLGLDFVPAEKESLPDDTPVIVVMHGLTGGSYESYVRAILYPTCKPVSEGGMGYRGIVVNFRGCAGVPLTAPQFYSAGYTGDIRQALIYISNKYPKAPLIGVGFSLGANVIVRYLAEEKEASRLKAGCALGCPWDLTKNNDALENAFLGRNIYSKGMANNLTRLATKHAEFLTSDPSQRIASAYAKVLLLKSPTLEQFDQVFTSVVGGAQPNWPFPSAAAYYIYASSHYVLPDVRVPLLALNAADDPVVQKVPVELSVENQWVTTVVTKGGGHLGWFQPGENGDLDRWIKRPVLEYLDMVAYHLEEDGSRAKQLREIYVDDDGFLKEVGRENLGCKEIDSGTLVQKTAEEGMIQGL